MVKRIANNILKTNYKSTFLSCAKDQETIWRKLFVESRPYSDKLKRLLLVNTANCLDPSQAQYQHVIDEYSIKRMKDEDYIKVVPKLSFGEHEEVKSYILLEFDNFVPSANPEYRNCVIDFAIVCHLDYWEMDNYELRPWMIAGYIDGILNGTSLSGIGRLEFASATQLDLNEPIGGVLLRYMAVHGKDDEENLNEDYPAPQDLTGLSIQ